MEKILNSTWFAYIASIGFIIWGIYSIKAWKKYKNPSASPLNRAAIDVRYLYVGIGSVVGGILFLIILTIQDCIGWVAK